LAALDSSKALERRIYRKRRSAEFVEGVGSAEIIAESIEVGGIGIVAESMEGIGAPNSPKRLAALESWQNPLKALAALEASKRSHGGIVTESVEGVRAWNSLKA